MRSRPLYDVVAVLARLGVGIVFMAHGWQKIEAGITATGRTFDGLGVPLPTAAAVYSAFVELLGGAALIAGLGLPVTGALLFIDMAGAFIFVHADQGLFVVDGGTLRNGYELVLALGMASLVFAAGGGGRLTLDQWIIGKRLRAATDADEEDDAASFVESLRQAESKPPKKPRRTPKPSAPEPAAPLEKPTPEGSDDDLLVAGRRKNPQRRRASTTQPIKSPADDPKSP
ncbi:DoxX family protein [Actinomadura bangladeshensis]|uniref:DoxX family membrane protein n=1 Tax=Actinomadura bangladeshensis TaxID=453573 RepID=A0A6L9QUF2_9ACTN|nr:DoxX family protein [Actinomadura bangladeshensis]NEA28552.1 DoxX family membrane protein [Actinomadura bangladeshensis]